jgi:hypothetical protein
MKAVTECVTLLLPTPVLPISYLGPGTGYPEVGLRRFPQSLRENSGQDFKSYHTRSGPETFQLPVN